MVRIKLLTNGGHYGIVKAVNCRVPARKVQGTNMYEVTRKHLERLGAHPYSDDKAFRFVDVVECVEVSIWQSFKEWASGDFEQC